MRPQYWLEYKSPKYVDEERIIIQEIDKKYGLYFASLSYAIFETVLRISSGRTIEEHRKYMGELFKRFSKVGSKSPLSWSQKHFS